MEGKDIDNSIIKFGKVIFEKNRLTTHLAVGLSTSKIPFKDSSIPIKFNYISVRIKLRGAEFDEFSYTNTKSTSERIEVTNMLSALVTSDASLNVELNIDIPKPIVELTTKVTEKSAVQHEGGETHKRTLPDLRITINNISRTAPEWKIHQLNNTALVLDAHETTKMAVLDNIGEITSIVLSGSIWTDRDGYELDRPSLELLEKFNPSLRIQLCLYKMMVRKRVMLSKPLHIAHV